MRAAEQRWRVLGRGRVLFVFFPQSVGSEGPDGPRRNGFFRVLRLFRSVSPRSDEAIIQAAG